MVSALQSLTHNCADMLTLRFFLGVAGVSYGPGVRTSSRSFTIAMRWGSGPEFSCSSVPLASAIP
ncbi:hypothetical protein V1522DRAFT_414383 [Lipomyces starkeyi]